MTRILNSCGALLQVTEVQPLCEKVVSFNGHDIVMTARAKDLSVRPTAIALEIVQKNSSFLGAEIVIGNLKPDKVTEILNTLGTDEFYDFSQFTYQDIEEKKIIDGGKSEPYTYVIEKMVAGEGFCRENHYEGPVSIPYTSALAPQDRKTD